MTKFRALATMSTDLYAEFSLEKETGETHDQFLERAFEHGCNMDGASFTIETHGGDWSVWDVQPIEDWE